MGQPVEGASAAQGQMLDAVFPQVRAAVEPDAQRALAVGIE
jgi:hypothetical protein